VLRGLVVAIGSLLVASVAHVAGGGTIGAVGFALASAFSVLASIALSGRTVSWTRTSIAVLFSQGVFHLLFGIGTGVAVASATNPTAMVMPGMPSLTTHAVGHAAAAGASVSTMPDDGWMWAAHAAAALLTIVGLVRGEQAFWRLAEWVAYSARRLLGAPNTIPRRSSDIPPSPAEVRSVGLRVLLAGTGRRGPPALVASR
jgi:hypothetical protein